MERKVELTTKARAIYAKLGKRERAIIKFGMIPIECARELEGFKPREIALAFFDCANEDGGMRV
jgi:hypothetical protein